MGATVACKRWCSKENDRKVETMEEKSEAEEPLELQEILKNASVHVDLEPDCWTASVFVCVMDLPNFRHGKFQEERMMRTFFVCVCYLLNLVLQYALLYFIFSMVTLPSMRRSQELYHNFHKQAFEGGEVVQAKFEAMSDRKSTCEISLNEPLFISAILFLWSSQCVDEFRSIYRFALQINTLPPLPRGLPSDKMQVEESEGEGHFVETKNLFCCIDGLTRFLIWTLVILPRLVVCTVLLFLGCTWLVASEDFGSLILNALALAFVTEIDSTIFHSFLPPILATKIEQLKIAQPAIQAGEEKLTEEERDMKDIWRVYIRSAFFLSITVGFVAAFIYFQPVIPGFGWDADAVCEEYLKKENFPWCSPFSKEECFPTGSSSA